MTSGCGPKKEVEQQPLAAESPKPANEGAQTASPADAQAVAAQIFQERCVTCHGPEGRGDGPAGALYNPPPRNFHDPKWQKSVTDDTLAKVIVYGGAAAGLSTKMSANPDLQSKPAVVAALVQQIRAFGREEPGGAKAK